MGLYMRKPAVPEIVEAERVGVGAQHHPQFSRPARPGEWVVTNHATGEQATMTNEQFNAEYMPLPVPSHLLAPEPGTGPEFEPASEPTPAVPVGVAAQTAEALGPDATWPAVLEAVPAEDTTPS